MLAQSSCHRAWGMEGAALLGPVAGGRPSCDAVSCGVCAWPGGLSFLLRPRHAGLLTALTRDFFFNK